MVYRETILKIYLHRVDFQQPLPGNSRSFAPAQHEPASPNTRKLADRANELKRKTLRILQYLHRDLQGSYQLRAPPLVQKELIRRNAWLSSRGIKSQKCISIKCLPDPSTFFSVGKRVSRPGFLCTATITQISQPGGTKLYYLQVKFPKTVFWRVCTRLRIRESDQLRTVLAVYEQEVNQDRSKPSYQKLKTMVRRHVDQMIRTRSFKVRNGRIGAGSIGEDSEKGRMSALTGHQENAFSGSVRTAFRKR